MQAVDSETENQRNYERLMVALETSQGNLDLLIAVCDDANLQAALTQQYISELQEQEIPHYRVFVQRRDPSLRYALEQLVQQQPDLQQGQGVVTVQGLDDLLSLRLGADQSEQERLFGYLQWTREALRQFNFPVVIWVNRVLLVQLAEKAPDFWSWRGGVFWFAGQTDAPQPGEAVVSPSRGTSPVKTIEPKLADLLHLIEQIEQEQGQNAPQLAALYEQLGELYAQRFDSGNQRQFAILAYKRAIQLQRKLGGRAELAESLERLGHLYLELKNDVHPALEAYQEAIELYREVGARLGEANTLRAIGDVLQFLNRSDEALSHYQQAIGLYREVGDRLGEANVLQELGKLQTDAEAGLADLNQAQERYEQIGDQYSQSCNWLFIADCYLQLQNTTAAIQALQQSAALAAKIGYAPFQQDALDKIAQLRSPAPPPDSDSAT